MTQQDPSRARLQAKPVSLVADERSNGPSCFVPFQSLEAASRQFHAKLLGQSLLLVPSLSNRRNLQVNSTSQLLGGRAALCDHVCAVSGDVSAGFGFCRRREP